ncbi:MAG: pilus assembly protein [Eggerthellaceae bacterium]|nr:pilus assembly protein [Eggerthellaceae bacterium]
MRRWREGPRAQGASRTGRAWGRRAARRAASAGEEGQATVEAAFALPVLCLLALLLAQPGILLYDRLVMEAAAAEGCRLLATRSDAMGDAQEQCENYVLRHLGSVPPVDCFHVHGDACTWKVDLDGDERSEQVRVTVSTEVRPLPLLDAGAALLGLVNERGNLVLSVERSARPRPAWVGQAGAGDDPAQWIGAWVDG